MRHRFNDESWPEKELTNEPNKVSEYPPSYGTESSKWDSVKDVPFAGDANESAQIDSDYTESPFSDETQYAEEESGAILTEEAIPENEEILQDDMTDAPEESNDEMEEIADEPSDDLSDGEIKEWTEGETIYTSQSEEAQPQETEFSQLAESPVESAEQYADQNPSEMEAIGAEQSGGHAADNGLSEQGNELSQISEAPAESQQQDYSQADMNMNVPGSAEEETPEEENAYTY